MPPKIQDPTRILGTTTGNMSTFLSPYRSSKGFPFFPMITSSKIWENLFESLTKVHSSTFFTQQNKKTLTASFYFAERQVVEPYSDKPHKVILNDLSVSKRRDKSYSRRPPVTYFLAVGL